MSTSHYRLQFFVRMALSGLISLSAQTYADSNPSVDLGTVQNDAGDMNNHATEDTHSESAPAQAPTQASLSETEPASIISRHYIEENAGPGSNYTDIVSIAPSVWNVDPNGNGLMESQGLSIRGFQDGQYNVTFDGIPIGDSNDFTHHSTSYFMPQDLGAITVDRGPGSAATIGDATFGGTIANTTKDPSAVAGLSPYLSYGSFNTRLIGGEFDSGTLQNWGDASAYMDVKQLSSDGYLSNSNQRRTNALFKLLKPLNDSTVLTLMGMYNDLNQNVPLGATLTQMAAYGNNFGLSSNPNSQTFSGYNMDKISGDMSYIGINTVQNSWTIDNKLYTFGYRHHGYNGNDLSQTFAMESTGPNKDLGTTWGATDVPGQAMTMMYRSVGDTLRASDHLAAGDLNVGLWYDHQDNSRSQFEVDYTLGQALNPGGSASAPNPLSAATDRLMTDTLDTLQPYAEFAWKATEALTIRPGLKYVSFTRHVNAPVDQGTKQSLDYSHTWSQALPSLDIHYQLTRHWITYAQASEGFLAPNLNTFYTATPGSSDLKAQSTQNYQWGTVYKTQRFTGDFDLYYIRFANQILSQNNNSNPNNIIFYNSNGATHYKGVEAEGTYYLGSGFSLYSNGSVNSAHDSAGNWLPNAPIRTMANGLTYDRNGLYLSLLDKFIGQIHSPDTGTLYPNGANFSGTLGGFSTASLTTSYSFGKDQATRVSVQVDNLFNHSGLYMTNGTGTNGDVIFWSIPGRALTLSMNTKI